MPNCEAPGAPTYCVRNGKDPGNRATLRPAPGDGEDELDPEAAQLDWMRVFCECTTTLIEDKENHGGDSR